MQLSWTHLKILVFSLGLWPFLWLAYDVAYDRLGANPIEALHFRLGDWALRFLCLGLALTPIRKLFKQNWPVRFRRMFGLFAFFYASLHFLVYVFLDVALDWDTFSDELRQSPYIIAGLISYSLLVPLALTSSAAMQKRLGRYWLRLHKLVYVIAMGAVVHYIWLVKSDLFEPLVYFIVVVALLLMRVGFYWQKQRMRLRAANTKAKY